MNYNKPTKTEKMSEPNCCGQRKNLEYVGSTEKATGRISCKKCGKLISLAPLLSKRRALEINRFNTESEE